MEYKELIDALRNFTYWCGSSQPYAHDIHPKICDDASDTIEALTVENARLRAELDAAVRCVYRYDTQPQDNYFPNCGARMDGSHDN